MPFNKDTRCGLYSYIELNVSIVLEEMESFLEKVYDDDIDEGSDFWLYIHQIEIEFNNISGGRGAEFYQWFFNEMNHNNVEMWDTVYEKFVWEGDLLEVEVGQPLTWLEQINSIDEVGYSNIGSYYSDVIGMTYHKGGVDYHYDMTDVTTDKYYEWIRSVKSSLK